MKSLIICFSYHQKNTEKIAKACDKVLDAEIKTPVQIDPIELQDYDLVGFGSGIYDYKHHKTILDLADKLPHLTDKNAFIFSTSGAAMDSRIFITARKFHDELREKLISKGYTIVCESNCVGFNTNSFLKYFGGMNKGRPNDTDLKQAEELAQNLREKDIDVPKA